jgi:hypothetical protein
MRSHVRKFAHILERSGLAMAGAASGLFVGAHVGSTFSALTSEGFLLLMMLGGAVGFYLGIDAPQMSFNHEDGDSSPRGRVDAAELLSALGTFLAAFSAFASVIIIILRHDPHIVWTTLIMVGWTFGISMQIVAGAIARLRARHLGWSRFPKAPRVHPTG